MPSSAFEGSEVAYYEGLETPQEELEAVEPGAAEVVDSSDKFAQSAATGLVKTPRPVHGIRKTTFWLGVALMSICVIAGGVGGGVGASKKAAEG